MVKLNGGWNWTFVFPQRLRVFRRRRKEMWWASTKVAASTVCCLLLLLLLAAYLCCLLLVPPCSGYPGLLPWGLSGKGMLEAMPWFS